MFPVVFGGGGEGRGCPKLFAAAAAGVIILLRLVVTVMSINVMSDAFAVLSIFTEFCETAAVIG